MAAPRHRPDLSGPDGRNTPTTPQVAAHRVEPELADSSTGTDELTVSCSRPKSAAVREVRALDTRPELEPGPAARPSATDCRHGPDWHSTRISARTMPRSTGRPVRTGRLGEGGSGLDCGPRHRGLLCAGRGAPASSAGRLGRTGTGLVLSSDVVKNDVVGCLNSGRGQVVTGGGGGTVWAARQGACKSSVFADASPRRQPGGGCSAGAAWQCEGRWYIQ